MMKSLIEEFNQYIKTTDWNNHNWYKELKSSCETMKKIKEGIDNVNTLGEIEEHLKRKTENQLKTLENFIYKYIFEQKNGIASIGQGNIWWSDKNPHRKEITKKINNNIDLLLEILKSNEIEKSSRLITEILKVSSGKRYESVKYRFLIALFPKKMTVIAYKKQINILFKKIKEQLNIEKSSKNILENHKWLIEQLSESNEDIYKKQIFYWDLYNKLTGESSSPKNKINQPLNQILYGPPGTGKTYNTINKALEIIDNEFYLENQNNREILNHKFEEYRKNKQIEFITFHQSYGYEEFVEGIKAIPVGKEGNETNEMIYDVVDGVFKNISKRAKVIKSQSKLQNFNWDRNNIFKMSLGGKYDENILEWCLENGYISMVWGSNIDFSKITKDNWEDFRDESKELMYDKIEVDDIPFTTQAMYAFKKWMKINDLVFISVGNLKIVAIGQVIGNYEFKDDVEEIPYMQYRKVKWLFIDREGISPEALLNKKISQQTIYNLNKKYVKKDFFNTLFKNELPDIKPHILIIDEINRGNISKIFGELITLIEDSKRLGNEEELEITLPYSGEKIGVPNNLYILGTMNTADRSIALMDTALRRRFDFEEMMPNHNLTDISIDIEGINLQEVLRVINQRIEYLYDRDHMIGHAYFIGIKTKEELDNIMKNKIIPLLQEYFYDDWEKIQIILGDHEKQENKTFLDDADRFIFAKKLKEIDILGFDHDDIEDESISYTINNEFTENSYIKVYKKIEMGGTNEDE